MEKENYQDVLILEEVEDHDDKDPFLEGFLTDFKEDLPPPEPVLPGSGEPAPVCGSWRILRCAGCGTVFQGAVSCNSRMCPRCYRGWARQRARHIVPRIMAIWSTGKLCHAIVSKAGLPTGTWNFRRSAMRFFTKGGIDGGVMFCHPWRESQDQGYVPDGYLHVHCIGSLLNGYNPVGDKDQHLFKVISTMERVTDNKYKVYVHKTRRTRTMDKTRFSNYLVKVVAYNIEHAAVAPGKTAYSYWGTFHHVVVDFEDIQSNACCETCGSTDVRPISVDEAVLSFSLAGEPVPAWLAELSRMRDRYRPCIL